MTSRSALVFACALILALGLVVPAAAAEPASQASPAAPATPLLQALESAQGTACAGLSAQPVEPKTGDDPLGSLEVNPFASSQNLCTHDPCPPNQLYDCVCMVCHPRCQSGWFFDQDLCVCQPV